MQFLAKLLQISLDFQVLEMHRFSVFTARFSF